MKWSVGSAEIHQIVELETGVGTEIQSLIKDATPANISQIGWLYPDFVDEQGRFRALVQCFLIKSDGKNVLVDTCNGNDKARTDVSAWGNLKTDFLKRFAKTGIRIEDVHFVVCTHLHFDHVGWNTRLEGKRWVPTFPNAEYVFAREEYQYWKKKPAKELADDNEAFGDSVEPIVKAGLAHLVDSNYKIDDQISLMPSPGHTPGHCCVEIKSDGERGIITGDFLHHPCQIAHPEWMSAPDFSPEKNVATRKTILDEAAKTGALFIGSHFANPVAGVVRKRDGSLFFDTEVSS